MLDSIQLRRLLQEAWNAQPSDASFYWLGDAMSLFRQAVICVFALLLLLSTSFAILYFARLGLMRLRHSCIQISVRVRRACIARRPEVLLEPLLSQAPQALLTTGHTAGCDWRLQLWEDGSFSDCVVKCDGKEWKVHRCVISLRAPGLAKAFETLGPRLRTCLRCLGFGLSGFRKQL